VRTPRGDDKPVGDGALALEVDENDVLGLVVVEAGQDQVFQGADAVLVVLGGVGVRMDVVRGLRRTGRGLALQRGCSFVVLAA
jgi:hypothetical protein